VFRLAESSLVTSRQVMSCFHSSDLAVRVVSRRVPSCQVLSGSVESGRVVSSPVMFHASLVALLVWFG
jgi:hypothetical protein